MLTKDDVFAGDQSMDQACVPVQGVKRQSGCAEQLLVLPVPVRIQDGQLLVEMQAHNGFRRWLDSFETLIVACPLLPEPMVARRHHDVWISAETLHDRIEFVPLPWARSLWSFTKTYRRGRRMLADAIERSQYLQFAIGGLIGDWAAVAAEVAISLGRRYAVHMDRVEHEVMRRDMSPPLHIRMKWRIMAEMMKHWHRRLIAHSSLALCHGSDCYAAYKDTCPHAHLIHNVHTGSADLATEADVRRKILHAQAGNEIVLSYAGRLDAMKAPLEWVRAIAHARDQGVPIRAQWLGDGPMRGDMEKLISELRLTDEVQLAGFVSERARVLEAMRQSDVFLFTHVTPESPRCLIESLVCSTPIVGYGSPYSEDLIHRNSGGLLVPTHDWQALGDALVRLHRERAFLADLIGRAAQDGSNFTSEHVFQERSELIKKYL